MKKKNTTSKRFLKLAKIEKENLLIFKNKNVWFSDNALLNSICIFKLDYFMQIDDRELKTIFSSRFFIVMGYMPEEKEIVDMISKVKLMRKVIKSTSGLNKNTLVMLYPLHEYLELSFDFIFLAYGKENDINIISLNLIDKDKNDPYWEEVMPKKSSKHVLDYYKPLGEILIQYIAENHIVDLIKISNILFLPFVNYNPDEYLFDPKFADMYEVIEQTSISAMVLANNTDPLIRAFEDSFRSIDVQRTEDWIFLYYIQDDEYYKKNKDSKTKAK